MITRRFLVPITLVAATLLFSAAVQTLAAFTEPTASPPNADAYAPLTTSPTAEAKVGGLSIGRTGSYGFSGELLSVAGSVNIGGTNPAYYVGGGDDNNYARFQYNSVGSYVNIQSYGGGVAGKLVLNPDGGNVGVGTASPSAKLDVNGAALIENGLLLNTAGAANGLIVQNGNVGIGVTSPTAKLEIAGAATNGGLKINENASHIALANSSGTVGFYIDLYSGYLRFASAGGNAVAINSNGQLTLGSAGLKIADGTQGAGKVLTSDANGVATWQSPTASSAPTLTCTRYAGSTNTNSSASCQVAGEVLTGGGCYANTGNVETGYPDVISRTFYCSDVGDTCTAYAVCCKIQ